MATNPEASGVELPFNLTDLDRMILNQTDEEYVPHSWEELKGIIGMGSLFRLAVFHLLISFSSE